MRLLHFDRGVPISGSVRISCPLLLFSLKEIQSSRRSSPPPSPHTHAHIVVRSPISPPTLLDLTTDRARVIELLKAHDPLPFIDQNLEILADHYHFCDMDGYSRFYEIAVHPDDQLKTTLLVLLDYIIIVVCISGYVMPQPVFKDA
jgi:hypothetical protein